MKYSVRYKVLAIVLSALILLGVGSVLLNHWQQLNREIQKAIDKYMIIGDILQNDINLWLDMRGTDVATMASNPMFVEFAQQMVDSQQYNTQLAEYLEKHWRNIINNYHFYNEIYFADPNGKIILSSDPGRKNHLVHYDTIIQKPLQTGNLSFIDIYLSPDYKPSSAYVIPVKDNNQQVVGVLVYRIDMTRALGMLVQDIDLGETGDVLLINKDQLIMTEIKDKPGSTFHHYLTGEYAMKVSEGEQGSWLGINESGQEVLAVYRTIPDLNWGLIVNKQTQELFDPIHSQTNKALIINILIALLALGVLYIVLNRILKPLSTMAVVAGEISQGNFAQKVKVDSDDEIGSLGQALNSMTDELGREFHLQQSSHNVMQSLVTSLKVRDILANGLNEVCRSFNFKVGAVYQADSEQKILTRAAVYSPGEKLLDQKETIQLEQGIEGLAATTGKVQVLSDLPADTVYTIDWLGGRMLPKCIIAVPLSFGERVLGVMCLASLSTLSNREIDELADMGSMMGVALHNALAYQKTKEMSVRLQSLNEQLTQQNEELHAQGEELIALNEELTAQSEELQAQSEELQAQSEVLQDTNNKLEQSGRLKSKFLASLSHELRAPLNAVIGFSDVLLDRVVGDINPQQEKYIKEILKSGQHQLNLINDLLDLSKIEAGEIQINIQPIDPAAPLEDALAMVNPEAQRKQIDISNVVIPNTYTVAADHDKLKQVFINLLSNAIKFTPVDGRVNIFVQEKNRELLLKVTDTGIGIAKEHHEVIFEEFKQANHEISSAYGGTGLGLPISKKLMLLQNGDITVESDLGHGATFIISLPLIPPDIVYLKKPIDKKQLITNLDRVDRRLVDRSVILVIDDEQAVRECVVEVLKHRGSTVITAEDGIEGIKKADTHRPDIIILDISMPGVDGFAVMDDISKYSWEKTLHLFVCTSQHLSAKELQYLEAKISQINDRS